MLLSHRCGGAPAGCDSQADIPESSRAREGKLMILENRMTVSLQAGVRLLFGAPAGDACSAHASKTKRFSRINEPFPKIVPKW